MATQNNGQVEEKLDYVRRGEPITADAWNKLVARANKPLDVSIVRTRRAKSSDGVEIRLARLESAWSTYDATVKTYHSTACFYDNGVADTDNTFAVYAPAVSSYDTLSRQVVKSTRFWIIFRNNRWELLIYNDPLIRSVTGGLGISVGDTGLSYTVSNTGVVEAKVVNNATTKSGTLFFSERMFEWVDGELDTSTKVLGVRYKQVQVVTDVALRNGALDVTKSEIVVIDYQYG